MTADSSSAATGKRSAIAIRDYVPLPPDPSIAEILTKSEYPLPHAVAELVDNSLDHGATNVVVRLLRTETSLTAIQVLDDGDGIDPKIFDEIMRFGFKSPHKKEDIGMFGVGLKTSSLSQAGRLLIFSKTRGSEPEGRQLLKKDLKKQVLGRIESRSASENFARAMSLPMSKIRSLHGTVVEWREVLDFMRSEGDIDRYLKEAMLDLDSHLGLTFHRFIDAGRCSIFLEIEQDARAISVTQVRSLNPFKYPKPGAIGWPKVLEFRIPSGHGSPPLRVTAAAHIWPPRTKLPEYKIRRVGGRTNTIDSQGLYFYLNDRLVIAGGWGPIRTAEAHLALARMAIEWTPALRQVVEVVYTKDKARIPASFVLAIRGARARDGTTYSQWIDLAQKTFRTADPAAPRLPAVPAPGRGFAPEIRRAIDKASFPVSDEVQLRWRKLAEHLVFKIDRRTNCLFLNELHRHRLLRSLGGESGLRIFCALLLHAHRDHFGDRSTPRLVRLESLINDILRSLTR